MTSKNILGAVLKSRVISRDQSVSESWLWAHDYLAVVGSPNAISSKFSKAGIIGSPFLPKI